MSRPRVVALAPGSPASAAGLAVGDEIVTIDGRVPADVIEYQQLVDEPDVVLEVDSGGLVREITAVKAAGESLGIEVDAAIFDAVRTCDNHCEFCFIYQLPKGMRRSLYLKDDDYRLSFLYGNFTTLTRFTEMDLERVVTERLSPLYVSIHATDPEVRAEMLRNRRGATSLRWLRALLDHGIEVRGQVVVCPGVNDGVILEDTMVGVLDEYPELASVAVVPLGISDHSNEARMRPHTVAEAQAVLDTVEHWQATFSAVLGRRMVFAADEYHLLADRPFPPAEAYEDFGMHEDGIGMVRTFERELRGEVEEPTGPAAGFFAWVEGAPAEGYRAPRVAPEATPSLNADAGGAVAVTLGPRADAPVTILTGDYGARVLPPMLAAIDRDDIEVRAVPNRFFGGNIGVAGLMVGADVASVLAESPTGRRYLLPDVCLSGGTFLDGMSVSDLPRPVEVVPTDGLALRRALGVSAAPVPTTSGARS
jgi:putative radical SAM enzyme (TIGR03279 family)